MSHQKTLPICLVHYLILTPWVDLFSYNHVIIKWIWGSHPFFLFYVHWCVANIPSKLLSSLLGNCLNGFLREFLINMILIRNLSHSKTNKTNRVKQIILYWLVPALHLHLFGFCMLWNSFRTSEMGKRCKNQLSL